MLYKTSSLSSHSSIASLGSTNSFKPDGSQTSLAALFMAGGNSTHQPVTTTPEGTTSEDTTPAQEFYPAPDPLLEVMALEVMTTDNGDFLAGTLSPETKERGTASSGLVSPYLNEDSSFESPDGNNAPAMTQQDNSNTPTAEPQSQAAFPAYSGNTVFSKGESGFLQGIVCGISVRNDTPAQLKNRIIQYGPATVVKGMYFPLKAIIEKGSDEHLTALLSALGKQPYRQELQTYMNTLASAGNDGALMFLIANDKVRQALGSWGNSAGTLKKSVFYSQLLATAAEHHQSSTLSSLLDCEHVTRHLPPSCYNELMSTLLTASQPDPELITALLKSAVCKKNLSKETLAKVAAYLIQHQPENKDAFTAFIYCHRADTLSSAMTNTLLTLYTSSATHNPDWSRWLIKRAWRSTIPPQTIGQLMTRFSQDGNADALTMLFQFSTLKKLDDSDKQNIIANMVENNQETLLLAFHRKGQPSMNAYANSINAIVSKEMEGLMRVIASHYRWQPLRALNGSKQDELTNKLKETAARMASSPDTVLSPAMKNHIKTILPRKSRPAAWKS